MDHLQQNNDKAFSDHDTTTKLLENVCCLIKKKSWGGDLNITKISRAKKNLKNVNGNNRVTLHDTLPRRVCTVAFNMFPAIHSNKGK